MYVCVLFLRETGTKRVQRTLGIRNLNDELLKMKAKVPACFSDSDSISSCGSLLETVTVQISVFC